MKKTVHVSILCGVHVLQNKVSMRILDGTKEDAANELLKLTQEENPEAKAKLTYFIHD